jgi:urea carboxylase
LRDFDQIQFYEVDQPEFERIYDQYKAGRYTFDVEHTSFDPVAYEQFTLLIAAETAAFVERRTAAGKAVTQEERRLLAEWRAAQSTDEGGAVGDAVEGGVDVVAPMTSSVYKMQVEVGHVAKEGEVLAILEAMKMEIREWYKGTALISAIRADAASAGKTVRRLAVKPGSLLDAGQVIMTLV